MTCSKLEKLTSYINKQKIGSRKSYNACVQAGQLALKENFDLWDQVLAECGHDLVKAEKLAVKRLVPPPHWTDVNDCVHCGEMPARTKIEGKILCCDWCGVL